MSEPRRMTEEDDVGRNPENCSDAFVTIDNGVEGAVFTRTQVERWLAEKDKVIKELVETLDELSRFWRNGTPVHPGSEVANEAMAQVKALRAEGKIQ